MKRIVLVATVLVAKSTSPPASAASIGVTVGVAVADCTINVCFSSEESGIGKSSKNSTSGEMTKRPNKTPIVSLSKRMLFRPDSFKTIPIKINDSGVTRFPTYVSAELANSGTGISNQRKTIEMIKPRSGGGNSLDNNCLNAIFGFRGLRRCCLWRLKRRLMTRVKRYL